MLRIITEPNFNSILGMQIKSYGGAYPSLLQTIYAERTIDLDSNILHYFLPNCTNTILKTWETPVEECYF